MMIHDTMCGDNRYVMQKMGDANSNAQKDMTVVKRSNV